ncbi:sugar ABC transporter permease [Paenibacillus marchantiophytorum]|uniref:Sugar ABC transporter permease n=1 Tax=Paenibacillus marchantiophytorum TaxID=1619310 RepID=A0ABQ1EXF8_9BACL|nr:sugar ABC transporter permease [Paenibacillus marchantiophytorum]GFZ91860.1 sugar ABC transporter permease [Paenibacillus marchantiophytorum]
MNRNIIDKEVIPWLFLLPSLIGFVFFVWHPFLKGFYLAFTDYLPGIRHEWVGFKNFKAVLSDELFYTSWANTLYFTLLSLLFSFTTSIVLAIALNETRKWSSILRISFYVPSIVPAVISSLLWIWMFNPTQIGMLNSVLSFLGIPAQPFINSPSQSMPSLLLMTIWGWVGSSAIVFLAGLQGVRAELYEACEIDGASIWKKIWYVTLPSIRPLIQMSFILAIVNNIKFFTEPFLMTKGGPVNSTLTVMLLNYNYAFSDFEYSKATAQAIITFLFILIFTLIYFRLQKNED